MDHDAYLAVIREESQRFLEALVSVPGDAAVPTCAGWTAADLIYHLAEVQHLWAAVVGRGVSGDEVAEPPRPEDRAELGALAARSGTELLAALAARDPDEECWSWHDDGHRVGWVARRQAHEAMVHRVDAEQTAGLAVTPPTVALAVDGVDELLRVMVDGVPAWGTFTPDGLRVRIECANDVVTWTLALGRFTGTGPESGTVHDLDCAALVQASSDPVDLTVRGAAWDLDRWLWGRGGVEHLELTGDPALAERLRVIAQESTQ